jgi:hypothetical protein
LPERDTLIGWCHTGQVHNGFMESVIGALKHDAGGLARIGGYTTVSSPYIPQARNKCVSKFLTSDCSWFWFLDTDVSFPPDTLDRMHDLVPGSPQGGHDPCVAASAYWAPFADGVNVVWLRMRDGLYEPVAELEANSAGFPPLPSEPIEVGAVGMGCTLIHRAVLEQVARSHADDAWPWFGHDMIAGDRAGEDVTFCHRAQQVGFRVYGLPVTVWHSKTALLGPVAPGAMVTGDPTASDITLWPK